MNDVEEVEMKFNIAIYRSLSAQHGVSLPMALSISLNIRSCSFWSRSNVNRENSNTLLVVCEPAMSKSKQTVLSCISVNGNKNFRMLKFVR